MTASDMPSRIAMPCPFAKNGTLGTIDNTSSTNMNYSDGFPTVYGAPSANSGKFVTRGEINRLGNIATNDMFYLKCGGLNTYDANFAQTIGGYPKGAVVIYLTEARELFYAISLVDNNLANLNETHNDNVNWAYLNQDDAKADTNASVDIATLSFGGFNTVVSYSAGSFSAASNSTVNLFKSKYTGSLTAISSVSYSSHTYAPGSTVAISDFSGYFGNGIMILDLGTSIPSTITFPSVNSFNGWKAFIGGIAICDYITDTNGMQAPTYSNTVVTAGNYYAIAIFCGVTSLTFRTAGVSIPYTSCNGGEVNLKVTRFDY